MSGFLRLNWALLAAGSLLLSSCTPEPRTTERQQRSNKTQQHVSDSGDSSSGDSDSGDSDSEINSGQTDAFVEARARMVSRQLATRDIDNQRVLDVMKKVPRHEFVSPRMRDRAYQDSPLPIEKNQTISQPYIVALMTQLVDPQPEDKALDIGTGSGYQAAVLAEVVEDVYSIEIVKSLADSARQRLDKLGYENISVRHGDGYGGWESEAPFDIIIVAAAPDHIPKALVEQLARGGKMVIPIGKNYQELMLIEKDEDGTVKETSVIPVRFVPMTGKAQE